MSLESFLFQQNPILSSPLWYSLPLLRPNPSIFTPQINHTSFTFRCSISHSNTSYGTVEFERRSPLKWNAIYKRISLIDEGNETGKVLTEWERRTGNCLTKWELCRVVKQLRKFNRFDRALQVYDWMSSKGERFRLSSSDAAIQLDLIGKVRGVSSAETFFSSLSERAKDKKVYGSLLNAYVQAKQKEKAESLLDQMRTKGYVMHCLPFNVIMTLYMNLKDYERVEEIVSEMINKNIQLDVYSYNIWLSCVGSQGSAARMEQVYEQMTRDNAVNLNWTTFSTMSTMYIKMGIFEKAEECLRKVESRIKGRDRTPYHYLIDLYGSIGNRAEVYRVWNVYKSVFPSIPNLGYHAIISSLLHVGDIEEAEKIYEEWLSVKSSYDPRIANLFMGYYVKSGNLDKATSFVDHIAEVGGKPNSRTWETLAEGYTMDRRVSKALSYWEKAFAAEGVKNWRPKAGNVSAFFDLCDRETDLESKQVLAALLEASGYLEDKTYASQIRLSHAAVTENEISSAQDFEGDINKNRDYESEILLNQL